MPCATLMKLCTKACINNIRVLTDVGDFEYWKIRDVLARVTSPEQLHEIELASPQILGEDEELWKALIARDIPEWKKKNYVPKDPKKWFQVYKRYRKEQQQEIERDAEQLKAAFAGLQKDKQNHVSRVVDPKLLPKLPRDPRMLANNGGVPVSRKKTFAKAAPTVLSWAGGSKTKMTNGASVMLRARREAHALTQRNKLITPTALLASSRVSKAPQSMVDEHRMAAIPAVKIFTPRRRLGGIIDSAKPADQASQDERERRLRALTATNRGYTSHPSSSIDEPKATVVAFDDESDDLDELFDEAITKRSASTSPQKTSVTTPAKRALVGTMYKPRPQPAIRKVLQPGTPSMNANGKAHNSAAPSGSIQPHTSSTVVAKSSPAAAQRLTSPSTTTGSTSRSAPMLPSITPTTSTPANVKSVSAPQKPLMKPKRRAEVDIFNRGGAATSKRSRIA